MSAAQTWTLDTLILESAHIMAELMFVSVRRSTIEACCRLVLERRYEAEHEVFKLLVEAKAPDSILRTGRTQFFTRFVSQFHYGANDWRRQLDPDMLMVAPAKELIRAIESVRQRDWLSRWSTAGGRLYGNRMIALKTDPVWERLSRFGLPWSPFDFNSGMDVEDITRSEALSFGISIPREQKWQGLSIDPDSLRSGFKSALADPEFGLLAAEHDYLNWR